MGYLHILFKQAMIQKKAYLQVISFFFSLWAFLVKDDLAFTQSQRGCKRHMWVSAKLTIVCQWLLCLQVELGENWPRHDNVGPQWRFNRVVKYLLKARGPQLARIGVPHWCSETKFPFVRRFVWTFGKFFFCIMCLPFFFNKQWTHQSVQLREVIHHANEIPLIWFNALPPVEEMVNDQPVHALSTVSQTLLVEIRVMKMGRLHQEGLPAYKLC